MKKYILILVLLSSTACAMDVLVAGQITQIRGMESDDGQDSLSHSQGDHHAIEMDGSAEGEQTVPAVSLAEYLQQRCDALDQEHEELTAERKRVIKNCIPTDAGGACLRFPYLDRYEYVTFALCMSIGGWIGLFADVYGKCNEK